VGLFFARAYLPATREKSPAGELGLLAKQPMPDIEASQSEPANGGLLNYGSKLSASNTLRFESYKVLKTVISANTKRSRIFSAQHYSD
jgi:hypothetical protein